MSYFWFTDKHFCCKVVRGKKLEDFIGGEGIEIEIEIEIFMQIVSPGTLVIGLLAYEQPHNLSTFGIYLLTESQEIVKK
jgi:hypothetical protein